MSSPLKGAWLLFAAGLLATFPEHLISVMVKLALTPLSCQCFSFTNVAMLNQLDRLSGGTFFICLRLGQLRWYEEVMLLQSSFLEIVFAR